MRPDLKPVLLAVVCTLVSACTVFAPRFDPYVSEKANTAYTEVAELLSAVELGKYLTADTFKDAVDRYASIDGKLAAAEQRVITLNTPTKPSADARDLLLGQIKGCRKQVRELADEHKEDGLQPGIGRTQGVLVSCDQAGRAANAMKIG